MSQYDRELVSGLENLIRTIPNFPSAGILFRDITPILLSSKYMKLLVQVMAEEVSKQGAEKIVGIESRGFIIGVPIAYELGLPFVPARKAGKLPAETVSARYSLEYGEQVLEVHRDAIINGEKVAIVDDLLATGGTAGAAAKLVQSLGGALAGFFCIIELLSLNGRTALDYMKVHSVLRYS